MAAPEIPGKIPGEFPAETPESPALDRRQALARLGLGAAVVYAAPTVLHLDRSARAVTPSCTGKSKGNPWCKPG